MLWREYKTDYVFTVRIYLGLCNFQRETNDLSVTDTVITAGRCNQHQFFLLNDFSACIATNAEYRSQLIVVITLPTDASDTMAGTPSARALALFENYAALWFMPANATKLIQSKTETRRTERPLGSRHRLALLFFFISIPPFICFMGRQHIIIHIELYHKKSRASIYRREFGAWLSRKNDRIFDTSFEKVVDFCGRAWYNEVIQRCYEATR